MTTPPIHNALPDALQRLFDEQDAATPTPGPVRRAWSLAMTWAPTERQLRHLADRLIRICNVADLVLKTAIVATAIFLAIEILLTFLPGGAAHRVIGGGQ